MNSRAEALQRSMTVWLITIGEPVPIETESADRLLRAGLLAGLLVERGHQVVWWTSTFDHVRKRHRFATNTAIRNKRNLEIRLVKGSGYRRNVSLLRLVDHAVVAWRWGRWAKRDSPPSIIVCSMPPIELAAVASRYAQRESTPLVVDIRDLWPDAFVDATREPLRMLLAPLLAPWRRVLRRALFAATAVTATSREYLAWACRIRGRDASASDRVFALGYHTPEMPPSEICDAVARLRALGVEPAKKICWFVGAFGATYDLTTVIGAARRLSAQREGEGVQVVLSGDGPTAPSLRQAARGLDNVVFTGWLDSAGLEAMAELATIGLAAYTPSAPQSLPNKLFDYLHAGLPIISSLGQEATQLLEEGRCGVRYEAGDPNSLTEQIINLALDEARLSRMSESAKELFDSRFKAEQVYSAMADFLEDLVSNGQPSPHSHTIVGSP